MIDCQKVLASISRIRSVLKQALFICLFALPVSRLPFPPLPTPPDEGAAVFNLSWDSNCDTPPAAAQTALETAAGIWVGHISSPVPITVQACWTDAVPTLADCSTSDYSRNFSAAPLVDVLYPAALANALNGADLFPGDEDMYVRFKSSVDWSYTSVRMNQPTSYDFVAVAVHEIGHGLGYDAGMYESYNIGFCANGPYSWYPCPTPLDWFAVDSGDVQLLNYLPNSPDTLGARLKSDANFGGPNTRAANSAAPVKLHTPVIWDQGSSLVHLDYGLYGAGADSLMVSTYTFQRQPGPLTLAILQDMGWKLAGGAANLGVSGPLAVGVGNTVPFEAALAWSGYGGEAMTYTWDATDIGETIHAGGDLDDTLSLTWTAAGEKTVLITSAGGGASASATRAVIAFNAAVSGPTEGDPGQPYTFNANLSPASTSLLVDYHWTASDQTTVDHLGKGTSDSVSFTWATAGLKTVSLTATISGQSAQFVRLIDIGGSSLYIYLPLVVR